MCVYTMWPLVLKVGPEETVHWTPRNVELHPVWRCEEDAEAMARMLFAKGDEEAMVILEIEEDGRVMPVWFIGQFWIEERQRYDELYREVQVVLGDCRKWWAARQDKRAGIHERQD